MIKQNQKENFMNLSNHERQLAKENFIESLNQIKDLGTEYGWVTKKYFDLLEELMYQCEKKVLIVEEEEILKMKKQNAMKRKESKAIFLVESTDHVVKINL
jgi:hypothetical protein